MEDKIARWENPPSLPPTHYVDNRIFTDTEIFSEEREGIFAATWKLVRSSRTGAMELSVVFIVGASGKR